MWCRVWKVNLLGEANLKGVCKVYQKGDPSEYHLTRTHRPTSATTTILTWSSYSQAIFLDKFRDREYKKPVLGVEAKKFCRRNILLMKNSTIESSFWKEIISYWYFFFLTKSSLIYKELCQKKKKKWRRRRKKKVGSISSIMSLDWVRFILLFLLLFIFSLTAFMTLWFHCINFLSWWESSTRVHVFHYENEG